MRGIESTANLGVPRYLIFYLTPTSLGDTVPGTCQPWPFFELYIDFRVPAWPSSSLGHPGLEYQENHDFRGIFHTGNIKKIMIFVCQL